MSQCGVLSRWKNLLDSKEQGSHVIALMEIAEMLSSDKNSNEKPLMLINSDAFHFISRIMSYHQRPSLLLINKIIYYVSRVPKFYKNDVFRVLRGFANVLNSFPTTTKSCDKDQDFQRIICCSLNFILKR